MQGKPSNCNFVTKKVSTMKNIMFLVMLALCGQCHADGQAKVIDLTGAGYHFEGKPDRGPTLFMLNVDSVPPESAVMHVGTATNPLRIEHIEAPVFAGLKWGIPLVTVIPPDVQPLGVAPQNGHIFSYINTARDTVPVEQPPFVLAVHDGDSYKIRTLETEWVRLVGVDCPEVISNHITANQEFGVAVGDSVRALLKGRAVTMRTFGKDKYGRTLAQITVNGRDLAEFLLAKGWAWYLSPPLDKATRKAYQKARDYAKRNKLGLWANPKPVKPSEFRKAHWRP